MVQHALLKARREDLMKEIARHHEAVAACEAELAEIEVAERVFARLSGADVPPHTPATATPKPEAKRPEGIPSLPAMITTVMQEYADQGMVEVTPKKVTEGISARWWPDVKNANVNAIMWRLKNSGRLRRGQEPSTYALPERKDAAGESPDRGADSVFN